MSRSVRWMLVVTIGLVILSCMGLFAPVDFLVAVTLGWIWYLVRTIPEIQIAPSGVATATVCLILLVVGLQYFLVWLYRELRNPGNDDSARDSPWKWRWTLGIVAGVILLFAAGTATVGVTHQLGWLITSNEPLFAASGSARSAARRAQSTINLKQIGLALEQYEQAQHSFPPGGTFERNGRALQSWETLIVPYLEGHEDLYRRIDRVRPWHDNLNVPVFQTRIPEYLRPGFEVQKNAAGYALSHYAGVVDMLGGDRPRVIAEIADGTSNTLMAGEAAGDFKPWGDPTNWRDPRLGLNRSPQGFGSPYPGGANFLFVDGSVRFIKNAVDPQVLKALSTPAGREKISTDHY